MSNFKKIMTVLFSVALFSLLIKPDSVFAKAGDPSTVEVQFNVYSDIGNMEENVAAGNFDIVTATFPVKKGEVWNKDALLGKAIQYAEPALKSKTGKQYTISDVIADPLNKYYIMDESYGMHIDNRYSSDGYTMTAGFDTSDYYDEGFSFTLNVLASKGGKLNGWKKYTDSARYYVNGQFKTGVQKIGQTTYVFNNFGGKKIGWQNINGHDMYFNETNGGLWTGKRKIGNTTYLFNSQGQKLYGWHRLNGNDYYFNESNGGMLTGERTIGETTYLFHNDGYKTKGWYVGEYGFKYYFDANYGGGLVTGLRKVGNAYYYFSTPTLGNAGSLFIGSAVKDRNLVLNGQDWYFNGTGIGNKVK